MLALDSSFSMPIGMARGASIPPARNSSTFRLSLGGVNSSICPARLRPSTNKLKFCSTLRAAILENLRQKFVGELRAEREVLRSVGRGESEVEVHLALLDLVRRVECRVGPGLAVDDGLDILQVPQVPADAFEHVLHVGFRDVAVY